MGSFRQASVIEKEGPEENQYVFKFKALTREKKELVLSFTLLWRTTAMHFFFFLCLSRRNGDFWAKSLSLVRSLDRVGPRECAWPKEQQRERRWHHYFLDINPFGNSVEFLHAIRALFEHINLLPRITKHCFSNLNCTHVLGSSHGVKTRDPFSCG